MLVDGFPVFKGQRKDGSNYSGKYKRAALKFECICSLSGVPLCIRGPFPGKQHDSAIFQSGNPLVHNPEELIIADKAYIGLPHCIVPQKKSKNIRPSKSLELWHRKYRAPVEHCFARFHKFRFMKYCYWSDALATKAVKFIAFCENTCRKSSFSGEPVPLPVSTSRKGDTKATTRRRNCCSRVSMIHSFERGSNLGHCRSLFYVCVYVCVSSHSVHSISLNRSLPLFVVLLVAVVGVRITLRGKREQCRTTMESVDEEAADVAQLAVWLQHP